jgi:rhodanese-related sulfurtransferase
VDPAGAARLVAEGKVVVIDVRTPQEYAIAHIKDARLIDFNAPDFARKLGELDRNQPYLVHCASGRRSTKSLEVFQQLGFKDVTHLDGGFNAWQAAGQPTVK